MSLDLIPYELVLHTSLYLPLSSITKLCQTNHQYNELICNNENFWRAKFAKDYGSYFRDISKFALEYEGGRPAEKRREERGGWKQLYKNYGNVYVFGNNELGQLGLGDKEDRNIPTEISDLKVKQISPGVYSTMVIDLDNNIWSFGFNKKQLGLGDNQDKSIPTQVSNFKARQVSVACSHSAVIDLENNVWVTGSNYRGQLGLIGITDADKFTSLPNFKAKQVSVENYYTIAIDLDDNVWVFGKNDHGTLGLNVRDGTVVPTPTQIPNFKARQISTRSSHTIAIDSNNNVWVFGWNE